MYSLSLDPRENCGEDSLHLDGGAGADNWLLLVLKEVSDILQGQPRKEGRQAGIGTLYIRLPHHTSFSSTANHWLHMPSNKRVVTGHL